MKIHVCEQYRSNLLATTFLVHCLPLPVNQACSWRDPLHSESFVQHVVWGWCRQVALRHQESFAADRVHNLIVRLHHNVIRTGLRRINLAYSRISLADVASKLGRTLHPGLCGQDVSWAVQRLNIVMLIDNAVNSMSAS